MKYQIAPPASWEVFEDVCLRLWQDIWADPNAKKNGRRGQKQNGVDIYGVSSFDGEQHGVQCKGKYANYGGALTKEEIKDEADKVADADNDDEIPELASFIIATTSPRDVELQNYCRKLNEEPTHSFIVDVWSWDDIEEELQYRKDIAESFGLPSYVPEDEESPKIKINRATSKDRLYAFMTRPLVKTAMSRSMRVLLHDVFYEIMQNAFIHGKASQCMLVYEDDSFIVMDDGQEFNPETLIKGVGNGGLLALKQLVDVCGGDVSFKYEYKDDGNSKTNLFRITISRDRLSKDFNNTVEFFVTQPFQVQSRNESRQLALSQMGSLKTDDVASVLFGDMVPFSGIIEYVRTATIIVGADRIRFSLPNSKAGLAEALKKLTPNVIVR